VCFDRQQISNTNETVKLTNGAKQSRFDSDMHLEHSGNKSAQPNVCPTETLIPFLNLEISLNRSACSNNETDMRPLGLLHFP
jgi:hypothetical protein